MPAAAFTAATQAWFDQTFSGPTPVQAAGWSTIAQGDHALLLAPTGSGKTLAAFLWSIDRLVKTAPEAPAGVRVLYVSPLKALVYDIERNLRAPLVGILRTAETLQQRCRAVGVDMRTGDTPAADRRRQLTRPNDILVTTPESLYLMLGSQAANTLRHVHTVIVDEIHALAPTKRGAHLALSLERLSAITEHDPQRIGLSATVRPHQEVARFLGGNRPVQVVDRAQSPHLDLRVVVPVPDMESPPPPTARDENPGGDILGQIMRAEKREREPRSSAQTPGMWAAIYPALLQLIVAHRSTIVFVNSRSACERLALRLNELAGNEMVRAHHGSLALRKRMEIEEALKAGSLRGIVATSSLELGIDMGAVDLVLLVESPGSVARGLQRVGRAGHHVGETSQGRIFPKFRGDLLECAVVAQRMREGALEPVSVPQNALDVLAQQVVAMCVAGPLTVAAIYSRVTAAYPYHALSRDALNAVLDMLSGTYPSDEFADLRPHLAWDRTQDTLSPRRGARLVALLNAGTIPDRGLFGVFLGQDGPRVGELDEEMVHESRKGDTFMLGASTWRVEDITRDRVIVSPAPGEPGRMPFWRGDGPGRPITLGRAIGAFVRELVALPQPQARKRLRQELQLDAYAADNLLTYLYEQQTQTGTLPTDRTITIERFRDEIGDWRVCILTPFGARVHAPWALALSGTLTQRAGFTVQTMYTDDGIALRFADGQDLPPNLDALLIDPDELEDLLVQSLADSAMFASAFRENAGRALLLPRRRADARTPLWQQRLKAKMLLAAATRYPSFPIVLETYRQCMRDIFDVPALQALLAQIQRREVHVHWVETTSASPFARSLAFAYVAAYLYEQDAPLAERKAQALTLDRDLLRELLGQEELRELIDPAVLAQLEADLQGLSPERQARDANELHDLLRRVGDLSLPEVAQRCRQDPTPWLAELEAQRRAVRLRMLGEIRCIAAEDAGRYRDALGVAPPSGLPDSFLAPVTRPLETLLARYARTHGPFVAQAPAQRYRLLPAQIDPVLQLLQHNGQLVHGAMRPGGVEREWCDTEVLRRLKRATLAQLRRAVAAVEPAALGRFLHTWHGLDTPRAGPQALQDTLRQLEAEPLPWSALINQLLPARLRDFHADALDMLCATGVLVWVGCGPLGASDGRIKLLRRDQAPLLLDPPADYTPPTPEHAAVLQHLSQRGACFTVELTRVIASASVHDLDTILWDLVWAGQITNDTVQPLRGLGARKHKMRDGRRRPAPGFGGRWCRVHDLLLPPPGPTAQSHARAAMLLQRYGIVSREAAAAEELHGGFTAVYTVLKAMEEAGKARRGYFVEGLSGAQFAFSGAIERLRAVAETQDPSATVVAAVDPANPYGSLLPWPAREQAGRLRRVPGAWVVLVHGEPVLFAEPQSRRVLTFERLWQDPQALSQGIRGLRQVAARRRGASLHIHTVDGQPALRHPQAQALQQAGLVPTFDGFTLDAEPPRA